ncbi:hypothetical protein C5B96_08575 [Subtercola sp. Z020]|nr:hypothetical protein C5B96_08575 [Subtercola sp. Z020]
MAGSFFFDSVVVDHTAAKAALCDGGDPVDAFSFDGRVNLSLRKQVQGFAQMQFRPVLEGTINDFSSNYLSPNAYSCNGYDKATVCQPMADDLEVVFRDDFPSDFRAAVQKELVA